MVFKATIVNDARGAALGFWDRVAKRHMGENRVRRPAHILKENPGQMSRCC
jgi:hypothetical protein